MAPSVGERAQRFGAAMAALERELDWALLGACYCEGDAAGFFDPARRAALTEVGLRLADDVAAALPRGAAPCSLYVGAAVAELAPILAEQLVLGREVVWLNRPGAEVRELRRALAAVGRHLGIELPRPAVLPLQRAAPERCGHVWLVSVLTDPDTFPALHDALYERAGGELATARGDLAAERARAARLVGALLDRVAPPCVLTTTDEELSIVGPQADARGLGLHVPGQGRLSALVGDLVRVCRLSGGDRSAAPRRSGAENPT